MTADEAKTAFHGADQEARSRLFCTPDPADGRYYVSWAPVVEEKAFLEQRSAAGWSAQVCEQALHQYRTLRYPILLDSGATRSVFPAQSLSRLQNVPGTHFAPTGASELIRTATGAFRAQEFQFFIRLCSPVVVGAEAADGVVVFARGLQLPPNNPRKYGILGLDLLRDHFSAILFTSSGLGCTTLYSV